MPHAVEKATDTIANGLQAAPVMTMDDMQEAVDAGATCAACGCLLRVMWGGHYGCNCYVLSCGDMAHTETKRVGRKTKNEIEGEKVFRGYNMKALQEYTPPEMVERANSAGLFPQAMNQAQRVAIATICVEYGLDPLMNELMLYQGRPFVTMAARLRKAQEAPAPLASISTRSATLEEKQSRGYLPGDYVFMASAHKLVDGVIIGPFEAWGAVKLTEVEKNIASAKAHSRQPDSLPIVKDPAQHAEKRAISRSLRMGWHIPLPTFEDIGDEAASSDIRVIDITPAEDEAPAKKKAEKKAGGQGEAQKAEVKAEGKDKTQGPPATAEGPQNGVAGAGAEEKAATAAPAQNPVAEEPPPARPKGPVPATFGELKTIVHEMQPNIKLGEIDAWIAKTCGMDVTAVANDPAAAYTEIKTVCGWPD